jgi:hypothetical protein
MQYELNIRKKRIHCIYGGEHQVVCLVTFHMLDEDSIQGSIDAFLNGNNGGCEGIAISFNHNPALSHGRAFLG